LKEFDKGDGWNYFVDLDDDDDDIVVVWLLLCYVKRVPKKEVIELTSESD